jgi:hypothetical protein
MNVAQTNKRTVANAALESALGKITLTELQRDLLKSQWLETLGWMGRRAAHNWAAYVSLRLIAIVGAVFVPALIAITPTTAGGQALRVTTFTVSLCVALATAVESFFRPGERWRHYRRTTEALRLEGVQYLMLSGPYAAAGTHEGAFGGFAGRLNEILSTEVDVYFTKVAVEKPAAEKGRDSDSDSSRQVTAT